MDMKHSRSMQRTVAGLVVVAFSFLCLVAAPAQAAMVGTAAVLQTHDRDLARQKVKLFLDRQDVAQQLEALGVDPHQAKARVDTMTDAEIAQLSGRIDEMPAGGDVLGVLLFISVIAFVTLLVTDLMGVTDVFTFIKKR